MPCLRIYRSSRSKRVEGDEPMNAEKFLAAQRLNELENQLNIINKNIDRMQAVLDGARDTQDRTKQLIAAHRLAVDAMGDEP